MEQRTPHHSKAVSRIGEHKASSESSLDLFEYETQFFGFTPISFVDGITNAVNEYTFEAFDELQELLLKHGWTREKAVKELNLALAHMQNAVDKNFDLFELYVLRNIFRVPANVQIPTDKRDPKDGGESEEQTLDREIATLEKRLKAEHLVGQALVQEEARLGKQRDLLNQSLDDVKVLNSKCTKNKVPMLAEHAQFVCENALKLNDAARNLVRKPGQPRRAVLGMARPTQEGADLDSRFICHKQRIIVPSVRDLQAMAEAL